MVAFGLFSIGDIFTDPFEIQYGYSAIWLIVLYYIGVFAKRGEVFAEKRHSH